MENIYNYIRSAFGIFMPRSIYENYTDADLEDSTYEEDSYVNSEDSTYEEYPYVNSKTVLMKIIHICIQIRNMLPDEVT